MRWNSPFWVCKAETFCNLWTLNAPVSMLVIPGAERQNLVLQHWIGWGGPAFNQVSYFCSNTFVKDCNLVVLYQNLLLFLLGWPDPRADLLVLLLWHDNYNRCPSTEFRWKGLTGWFSCDVLIWLTSFSVRMTRPNNWSSNPFIVTVKSIIDVLALTSGV